MLLFYTLDLYILMAKDRMLIAVTTILLDMFRGNINLVCYK